MGPNLTAPQDLRPKPIARPLPDAVADVALLDIKDVCALVRMSATWVHDEVRAGRFPVGLRYGPRCTRWPVAAIRAYLIERAARPQAEDAELVKTKAKKASAAAQVKRAAVSKPVTQAARRTQPAPGAATATAAGA